MPGRTLSCPSTITCSPAFRPCCTTHASPTRSEVVMVLSCTLLSEPTVKMVCVLCNCWIARCGTSTTFLRRSGFETHFAELSGEQHVLRIRKTRLQFERASFWIHLIDRIFNQTFVWKLTAVVRQNQRQLGFGQIAAFLEIQILGFGHLKTYPDGIERNNRREWLLRGSIHQAAHRHQRIADQPANGRLDGHVFEVELRRPHSATQCFDFPLHRRDLSSGREPGLVDIRFIRVHSGLPGAERSHCRVQILLRSSVRLNQRLKTFYILLRFNQIGLGDSQVCFRLLQRYLLLRVVQVGFALRQNCLLPDPARPHKDACPGHTKCRLPNAPPALAGSSHFSIYPSTRARTSTVLRA